MPIQGTVMRCIQLPVLGLNLIQTNSGNNTSVNPKREKSRIRMG